MITTVLEEPAISCLEGRSEWSWNVGGRNSGVIRLRETEDWPIRT